jgi:mycofactocin precursor
MNDSANPEIVSDEAEDGGVELVTSDLLVEEVSIDGMCGVY